MRREICLCPQIAQTRARVEGLKPRSRVSILMHHRERYLTTNTARLATLVLPDCSLQLRGLERTPFDPSKMLDPGFESLFLYPSADAQVLSPELLASFSKPINLIVPDGSWRQAAKVAKREAWVGPLTKVILPVMGPSRYQLRNEPKEHGLATFEAIARALGIIEGEALQKEMEAIFDELVARTLRSRRGDLSLESA
jgi:DTW domain-containing protein YfiP